MQGNTMLWLEILGGVVVLLFLVGIRIVRPTHRGLVERLGKYHHFANPGFHWIIPIIDKLYQVNITEQLVNADPQEIITNDNLFWIRPISRFGSKGGNEETRLVGWTMERLSLDFNGSWNA